MGLLGTMATLPKYRGLLGTVAAYVLLDELNAGSDFWTILVRVLRKWNQYDKNAPDVLFFVNMLLIDEKVSFVVLSYIFLPLFR